MESITSKEMDVRPIHSTEELIIGIVQKLASKSSSNERSRRDQILSLASSIRGGVEDLYRRADI